MNASWTVERSLELLRYGVGGIADCCWEMSWKTGCLIRMMAEYRCISATSLYMLAISPQRGIWLVERDMLDLPDS